MKTVFDPEIPVDIYELGLIYDIIVDAERRVLVKMTLTSPACPSAQQIPSEVRYKVKAVPGCHRRVGRDRLGAAVGQGPDVRSGEAAVGILLIVLSHCTDLYQEVILDHNRPPAELRPLARRRTATRPGAQPALRRSADPVREARRRSHRRHPVRRIGLRDLQGVRVAHDRRASKDGVSPMRPRCSTGSTR